MRVLSFFFKHKEIVYNLGALSSYVSQLFFLSLLLYKLNMIGFHNLFYYPGGIEEYNIYKLYKNDSIKI